MLQGLLYCIYLFIKLFLFTNAIFNISLSLLILDSLIFTISNLFIKSFISFVLLKSKFSRLNLSILIITDTINLHVYELYRHLLDIQIYLFDLTFNPPFIIRYFNHLYGYTRLNILL